MPPKPKPGHLPPHLKPGHVPPHLKHKKLKKKGLVAGLLLSTIAAAIFIVGLYCLGVSMNTIIPAVVPLWVGILTITYLATSEK